MDENKINPSISDGQKTDVLLVHDKRAGTVNVVKGVDTDGSLQTVPPTQKHASEFMRVDNNSDPFTNFFSNFYRKINDTEGLGFFRCNASAVEQNAEAIRQGNKQGEMLRVPKPDFHEFPKNQYRIDPAKIDWDSLKKIGITEEMLKKTKNLDRMLRGYKSRNLFRVSGQVGDFYLTSTDAKISLYTAQDGRVKFKLHGIQNDEKQLQRPFHGYTFTNKGEKNLQETGNLGEVVKIKDPKSGEQIPVFISRDRETHELEYMRADKLRIPDEICKAKITDQQKGDFAAGRPVKVDGMTDKDGNTFSATLQVSAVERGIEFLPKGFQHNQQQQQGQNRKPYQWVDENGNIRAPKTIGGVPLTEEQQKKFAAEETIYVKGMKKDGQDQPYNAYIKFNREKGKPDFSRANPDKSQAKEIVPATESRTQVAVNSDGKTNEATKYQKEPLKQGQQKPTAGQKQNRVKKEQQEQKADKSLKADKPKKSKGIKL
ncbi:MULTISPECIES: DUF3945 domain-containing protein [Bacteroidaceae]|uniref:DUF3945 domain-containing protein n=1 Tax=Bacteroidaceae TaxID=815 RepID=UPI001899D1F1|nr:MULTISPECIES: DUF3945 domain-containing protein [Bacteroidaceae]CAG9867377.1 Hypothetical protein BF1253 [Bacteroides ovatus]